MANDTVMKTNSSIISIIKLLKASVFGISSNEEIAENNGLVKNMMSSSFKLIRNKST